MAVGDIDEPARPQLEDLRRKLEARDPRGEALVEAQVAGQQLGGAIAVEIGDPVALAPVAVELGVAPGEGVAAHDRRLERAARREAVGAVDEDLGLAVAGEGGGLQLAGTAAAPVPPGPPPPAR